MGSVRNPRSYCLYGVRIKSFVPLPGTEFGSSTEVGIELFRGPVSLFSRVQCETAIGAEKTDWFTHARLSDGSDYLQWSGLFEFLVSPDGRQIACVELDGVSPESLQTYLIGQVLSFALLKHGIEPLHSTTVVIDDEAVAFVGDCGYGKSSLGAAFLQMGYPLLTDDLLVLKKEGDRFVAYPGPPRIKLFPEIAKILLREQLNGSPMNNQTSKLVIPLDEKKAVSPESAFPLKAMYILTPPGKSRSSRISIRPLSPRSAFVEVIKNTFNAVIADPDRLERQFVLASRLVQCVPLKSLSYPRTLTRLSAVREAVRSDLNNESLHKIA